MKLKHQYKNKPVRRLKPLHIVDTQQRCFLPSHHRQGWERTLTAVSHNYASLS
ncbi:uncharacterized protein LY89DRAFT_686529 [Mollisia scopiformis]|uniref:Uncharacterized protein n=1 Tax=Mollisia scopiformis TaxID=149040 RepID=A0A194X4F0_MOLSC|nr:uncharacterized protein LY89DRAFT_686529 [Mollisia scopiformis]KUJ14929.1 hypothetical protein LY89DRAFT_686529 [Mollisia scopiformis]